MKHFAVFLLILTLLPVLGGPAQSGTPSANDYIDYLELIGLSPDYVNKLYGEPDEREEDIAEGERYLEYRYRNATISFAVDDKGDWAVDGVLAHRPASPIRMGDAYVSMETKYARQVLEKNGYYLEMTDSEGCSFFTNEFAASGFRLVMVWEEDGLVSEISGWQGKTAERLFALADDVDGCMPDPTFTPDMPEYHCKQGGSYYGQGLYDLAIDAYHKALEIDPAYGNAFHGLAFTYRAQGRLDLAIHYYGEVIRVQPAYAQPYEVRAEIYQFIGRYEDAEHDFNMFVELYGQYPVSYLARGDFYMDRRDYVSAAEDYAAAIARNPDLLDANIKYASALLLSGKSEEALEVFNHAITIAAAALEVK